jgi:biopolymer transport protein ExbD
VKVNSSSEKYDVMAEINMIPFIDVALVLLIIFMVMTPFLVKEQIKINLPKTRSVNTPVDNKQKPVQVNIASSGAIYVNGEAVEEDQIVESIKRHLSDPESQPVVIAADKDVAFEKVVAAMDAAKLCGAKKLGISAMHNEGGAAIEKSPAPKPPKPTASKTGGKQGSGGTAKPASTPSKTTGKTRSKSKQ